MATIVQFQKNLQKIANKDYLTELLFQELKRYENVLVNLNKKQLSEGKSTKGELFKWDRGTGKYTKKTQEIAEKENPRKPKKAGQPYNMEWTGELFDGLKLVFGNKKADFTTSLPQLNLLLNEGFKDILGTTEENQKEFISKVLFPAFMLQIRKVLGV